MLNRRSRRNGRGGNISLRRILVEPYFYGLHGNRFNDLFHDNHVQILKVTDTIRWHTNAPKGMWTMVTGD